MTASLLARDATGLPLEPGDRVGSFSRTVPGNIVERDGDRILVLHDGERVPASYLVGEISGCVPGLFLLNLEAATS